MTARYWTAAVALAATSVVARVYANTAITKPMDVETFLETFAQVVPTSSGMA